jgi:hypothetical protein
LAVAVPIRGSAAAAAFDIADGTVLRHVYGIAKPEKQLPKQPAGRTAYCTGLADFH